MTVQHCTSYEVLHSVLCLQINLALVLGWIQMEYGWIHIEAIVCLSYSVKRMICEVEEGI